MNTGDVAPGRYTPDDYGLLNPGWHATESTGKAQQVLQLVREQALLPQRICEVGCGAGGVLAGVAAGLDSCVTADGFDISHCAIELAQSRHVASKCRFFVGDPRVRMGICMTQSCVLMSSNTLRTI